MVLEGGYFGTITVRPCVPPLQWKHQMGRRLALPLTVVAALCLCVSCALNTSTNTTQLECEATQRLADLFSEPGRYHPSSAFNATLYHLELGTVLAAQQRWRESLTELQSAMIWASWLGTDDYERFPINTLLSVLVLVGNNARARGQQEAWPVGEELPKRAPTDRKPSIAIVTLCSYDETKTVLPTLSRKNRVAYGARNGYEIIFETVHDTSRPPAWSKITLMRKHLHRADWVMWADCDSFFMQMTRRLEDLLPTNPALQLVISEDALMVNSGIFLLRNSEWSAKFLDAVLFPDTSIFTTHKLWEQSAVQSIITRQLRRTRGTCSDQLSALLSRDPAYLQASDALDLFGRVLILPQSWINTYPHDLAIAMRWDGRPAHAVTQPHSFVVSFSGCDFTLGHDTCQALMTEYSDAILAANTVS